MVYVNLTEGPACDCLYWNIFVIHSLEKSTGGKMQVMMLKRWKECHIILWNT
jgi:hypothetical protein